jgi:hypothetical protein
VLAGAGRALRNTALATVCMAATVGGVLHLLDESPRVLTLAVAVLVGAAVYGTIAKILRIEMLSLFLGRGRPARV